MKSFAAAAQAASSGSAKPALRPLSQLPFDNRSLRELPVDDSFKPSQREVPNAVFALVEPTPLETPHLISFSKDVAENMLEVNIEAENMETASKILSGSQKGFGRPAAHCYCGHQFGVFAGQLGDGATMYIGETVNSKNERWEIQFKGAGLTPFSRTADGRKVLRSSIREYLCSEHLNALGIPSTRALSICTSDSRVMRDILYDGHPRMERCSVIIRVCETFIRFGSFEIARPVDQMSGRAGPNYRKNPTIVKQLVEYTMKHFYPDCATPEAFILEVTKRTARLAALWQCFGWCHGVLNTDNMSILGKTLDFGPFGFMERFDDGFICNRSDDNGRYAYSEQPGVCLWNCLKFLETLSQAGNILTQSPPELAQQIRDTYLGEYKRVYRERMREKLGLDSSSSDADCDALFVDLFRLLNETAADFTQTFRALGRCLEGGKDFAERDYEEFIKPCLGDVQALQTVMKPRYDPQQLKMLGEMVEKGKGEEIQRATGLSAEDVRAEIARVDKFYSLVHWSESDKRENDNTLWTAFLARLARDFKLIPGSDRRERMDAVNPRFVLRNHVAQRAIEKAEKGDFAELDKVLQMCLNPFKGDSDVYVDPKDGFRYDAPSADPEAVEMCAVSCSS